MDGPLTSYGGCPTTDSENLLTIIDTEGTFTLKSVNFIICRRDSVHCEGRQQTQQLVKQVLSRELQLVIAPGPHSHRCLLPSRNCQEDGGGREPQARHRLTGSPAVSYYGLQKGPLIPSESGPRLGGGPERARGAFGCLCIVKQLDTLHRAICKLSHGPLAFTNAPSSSRTKFHRPSCLFYYIRCYRPSHSQLRTSTAQTMSHLLTQHPTKYSLLAPVS